RDRRRSRSPAHVDRYEPRRRDDRDRDSRRRPSPPPSSIDRYVPGQDGGPSASVTVNPLADPSQLPYQVGFSYFGEWWRMEEKIKDDLERARTGRRREPRAPEDRDAEKAKIQAAYDTYKEELQAKMARTFVAEHKKEQWFKERYVPEIRDEIRGRLNEFRRGAYSQWEQDLESGTFDEFSLEGLPKSDTNGSGSAADKEEGEATSNEILGVGDLVPTTGADIRDENQYQPTLLIKTIAPHVSRQNLEDFCRENLGEEEGGFKWLSLSDPNPSKRFHRIGWVMLHPSSEAPLANDPDEDGKIDEEGESIEPPKPVSTAEKALEAINGKTVKDESRGDFVCHVGIHNPPVSPRKKALWDLFSAPERIDKDLLLIHRLVNRFEEEFGSDFQAILKIEDKVEELRSAGHLQPPAAPTPAKKVKQVRDVDMDAAMDGEEDGMIEEEDAGVVEEMEEDTADDEELMVKKKQLDLLIEYLRRVFSFCFFCVFECDSIHELTRKCPGGHLRRPRTTLSATARAAARASANGEPFPEKKRNEPLEEGEEPTDGERKFKATSKAEQQLSRAFNWVKTFEDKLMQILEPDSVDLRKLGGRDLETGVEDELKKHVKQEDEHKWRCKAPDCSKLFKEEHFWRKHVEKRHGDWVDIMKQELELINAYVIDPSHIAPSRTDANSNGHFPPANGQSSAGTPRGFNLQNFAMNGMMGMPGFPGMNNFGGMFSAMQGGKWNNGGDDRSGAGGPVRRGGMAGGRGAYRSGPYDRRPGGRFDGAGRGRQGGSRWGDGAGAGAGGPREAVQGRSLKSYEDLDHVAGSGSGELNY
ncbi:hypothetical protein CC79DRAFT_1266365, partial [Sarocladium strictum]